MAAAGGVTLYADYVTLYASSAGKPLCKLVQQTGASQSIPSATDTAITFGAGSEEIDTHGFHDVATNTTRITPTIAGYYRFTGIVWYAVDTDLVEWHAGFFKNGAAVYRNRMILPATATSSVSRSVEATTILAANGTTDYFELFTRQVQTAAAALSTTPSPALGFGPQFMCEFLRPL